MRTHRHHSTVHHVPYQPRPQLNGCLALFVVLVVAIGCLFFGIIAVANYHSSHYGLTLLGLAGVGGLVYGLFSYLRPYA